MGYRTVSAFRKIENAATMVFFDIWVPIFLILTVPACLGYPFNTRSHRVVLASPTLISQSDPRYSGIDYPVYSTVCLPVPWPGRRVEPSDIPNILSDCYWIINEDLLHQQDLLFQNLVFRYNNFQDQSGKRYPSLWQHGQCSIAVTNGGKYTVEVLQLFNIVLSANQILKDCIEDQRIPEGGSVPVGTIGLSDMGFRVMVIGSKDIGPVNEPNLSLLSNLSSSGRDVNRNLLLTTSATEPSTGDSDAKQSTMSQPDFGLGKRSSDSHLHSSLSTSTRSLKPGGAWGTLNLIAPLANLSRSVKAPPDHPVDCFNPYSVKLEDADEEDCKFVINEIILRYPNPMSEQIFGYGPTADFDLSLPENQKWEYGCCVIFVKNSVSTRKKGTFRLVDVALAAHRIVGECIVGARFPIGGTADVGLIADRFFVSVGGLSSHDGQCGSRGSRGWTDRHA